MYLCFFVFDSLALENIKKKKKKKKKEEPDKIIIIGMIINPFALRMYGYDVCVCVYVSRQYGL